MVDFIWIIDGEIKSNEYFLKLSTILRWAYDLTPYVVG